MRDVREFSNWDLVNNFFTYVWGSVLRTSVTDRMPASVWAEDDADAIEYISELSRRAKNRSDYVVSKCEAYIKFMWSLGSRRGKVQRWTINDWEPVDAERNKYKRIILSVISNDTAKEEQQ